MDAGLPYPPVRGPFWVTQTGPSSTGLQELKPTGASRGACGRREWCTLRWGRLPVPAKGGWSGWTRCWRLAAPAAFQRHPSLTLLMGATVGTFRSGRVNSVVLGGNQSLCVVSARRTPVLVCHSLLQGASPCVGVWRCLKRSVFAQFVLVTTGAPTPPQRQRKRYLVSLTRWRPQLARCQPLFFE